MRCVNSILSAFLAMASLVTAALLGGCGEQAEVVSAPSEEPAKSANTQSGEEHGAATTTASNVNDSSADPVGGTAADDDPPIEPDGSQRNTPAFVDPLQNLPRPTAASAAEQAEIGRQLTALVDVPELPPDVPEKFRDKLSKPPVEFEDGKIVYVQLAGAVRVTDEHLKLLEGLTGLRSLSLSNVPHITNRGLIHLRGLKSLERLSLNHNRQLGDEGIACLRELANLRQLELVDVGVTDAGLVSLSQLTRLETLKLQGARVSDAGLSHLRPLASLKVLWLQFTGVSRAAAENLQRDLPNVQFIRLSDGVLRRSMPQPSAQEQASP